MTSIIISGYGRMGHMVEKELERKGLRPLLCSEDICGVDPALCAGAVCIDFTSPAAFRANYPFIARHFRAAVVGTTGWDDIREEVFRAFSEAGTTLVYTSNFSIGVNALFAAVKKMAPLLQGYTAAIEEIHHVHKPRPGRRKAWLPLSGRAWAKPRKSPRSGMEKFLGSIRLHLNRPMTG